MQSGSYKDVEYRRRDREGERDREREGEMQRNGEWGKQGSYGDGGKKICEAFGTVRTLDMSDGGEM